MIVLGNFSVGHPSSHWSDDLRKTTGGDWMRTAENQKIRSELQEAYAQQRTAIG